MPAGMWAWPLLTHLSLPPPGRAAEPGSKCGLACPSLQPASLLGIGGAARWPSLGPPQSLPSPCLLLCPRSLGKQASGLLGQRDKCQMGRGGSLGAGQGGEASQLGSSLSKWCVWSGLSAHPSGAPSPPTGSSWGAGHKDSLAVSPWAAAGSRHRDRVKPGAGQA